ncbi:hypothetical protein [Actinomyces ruminis]|uniref:hypothetical protein n=1 Tax=Actinomyces ruminis TaxID=1937003 RepID=UPI001177F53D|nr:hypothetical protein [Actinomyces ruminis]
MTTNSELLGCSSQGQLAFSLIPITVPPTLDGIRTWVFLYNFDSQTGVLNMEVSLPSAFAERFITAWQQRILLPSVGTFESAGTDLSDVLPPATVNFEIKDVG